MQGIYSPLCGVIAEYLAVSTRPDAQLHPELEHLRRALASAAQRPNFIHTDVRRYLPILERALQLGRLAGVRSIASALQALPAPLPWDYHYLPRAAEADLSANIGFAELIGPEGPLWAGESRVGFTLIEANTEYPLHAHPAIELYMVIAGTAIWTASAGDQWVPPGGFVLHQTNEPHGMQTRHEPLLALYSWRGDLDTAAYYL